jgi:hypothetical protein
MNRLNSVHQDGPQEWILEEGGYCISNGLINISIETKSVNQGSDRPDKCLLICLEKHEFPGEFKVRQIFGCLGGMTSNKGKKKTECKAWGYAGPHFEKMDVKFQVDQVNGEEITFLVEAIHDDLRYNGPKGKETVTTGIVRLGPATKVSLWNPA